MIESIKAQWVAALRSGKYRQGKGTLRKVDDYAITGTDFSYCCLGVLCEIAVEHGIVTREVDSTGRTRYVGTQYVGEKAAGGSTDFLPHPVRQWANIPSDNGGEVQISTPSGLLAHVSLISLNDDRDYDFLDIANLIEEQL